MRITRPVPGNHETYTLYTQGYDDYFGKGAHGPAGSTRSISAHGT